ncbi:MAG TPA: 23S rRNA (guanosine(2251)-2'-O)-methyltransferase RlmB, partial [Bacteroidetes bacterium]|nr:23S rRNA (guanosine(2251)-2'-O)-methyltransferase RlmB [Bacteroidota bacterium]
QALLALREEGWWIVGAGAGGGSGLWEHRWAEKTVLILGSEGRGLGRRVLQLCDEIVHIPLAASVESLSVSAAAAVLLFDRSRKVAAIAEGKVQGGKPPG